MKKEPTKEKKDVKLISNNELYEMEEAVNRMNGLPGAELGAKRARLRRLIKDDVAAAKDFMDTPEWKRLNDIYLKIDEACAKRDAQGNPMRNNQGYIVDPDKVSDRIKAYNQVKIDEKVAYERRDAEWKEYTEGLNKPKVDISGYSRIPFTLFPKDTPNEIIDWLDPVIDYEL